jgi:hypothetical protein
VSRTPEEIAALCVSESEYGGSGLRLIASRMRLEQAIASAIRAALTAADAVECERVVWVNTTGSFVPVRMRYLSEDIAPGEELVVRKRRRG